MLLIKSPLGKLINDVTPSRYTALQPCCSLYEVFPSSLKIIDCIFILKGYLILFSYLDLSQLVVEADTRLGLIYIASRVVVKPNLSDVNHPHSQLDLKLNQILRWPLPFVCACRLPLPTFGHQSTLVIFISLQIMSRSIRSFFIPQIFLVLKIIFFFPSHLRGKDCVQMPHPIFFLIPC